MRSRIRRYLLRRFIGKHHRQPTEAELNKIEAIATVQATIMSATLDQAVDTMEV